jgi:hypothetical protein
VIEQKTTRYPNLCAEIARCDETYATVSELLDISISAVSRRMNGAVEWSKREIDLLCDHYGKDYDYLFKE